MKKILSILLIFLFMFSPLINGRNFQLGNVYLEYKINKNGTINVKEVIPYNLQGCFKELYVQKPPSLKIYNARGECIGAKCEFRVDEPYKSISGDRELILKLKEGRCDNNVTAIFKYDIAVLRKNKDNVQFFYKLWGDKWGKDAELTVKLILPGKVDDAIYMLHENGGKAKNVKINKKNNILELRKHQPPRTFFEINLLMPIKWFGKKTYYIEKSDVTLNEIKKIEEREPKKDWLNRIVASILTSLFIISLIPLIIFLIAYLKYGREFSREEVGYNKEYETYPPYKMSAAQASFYLNGKVENNALPATIMMLVYKKYLEIEEDKKNKDVVIKIKNPKIKKELTEDEKEVLDLIKKYSNNGIFTIKEFDKKTRFDKELAKWYKNWVKSVKKKVEKDLDFKINNIVSTIVTIWLIFSVFIPLLPFFSAIINFIIFMVLITRPSLLGKWTKEGRVKNLRWNAFKKYLEDYTLLKQKPPSSVELWDLFMVYAIAFGVAKKVLKLMKTIPHYNELEKSDRYVTYSLITSGMLYNAFTSPSFNSSSGASGGSFGGVGGGFGGGGGGAR